MAEKPPPKPVKTGLVRGHGRPPGYLWNVDILNVAFEESASFLNEEQREHLRDQVKELARSKEPTASKTVDVEPIEDFYELRDKGGILGKFNVRLYFGIVKECRLMVVLGVLHKQNNGKTPAGDRVRMRNRFRRYRRDYLPHRRSGGTT